MSELSPGLEYTLEFTASDELLTDVEGTLPRLVLSTPGMIERMELAAGRCVRPRLPPGGRTVGFEMCVRHLAAAFEGAPCTARATLREVAEGRKLRFDVEVREGDRLIGVGTHERRLTAPR